MSTNPTIIAMSTNPIMITMLAVTIVRGSLMM